MLQILPIQTMIFKILLNNSETASNASFLIKIVSNEIFILKQRNSDFLKIVDTDDSGKVILWMFAVKNCKTKQLVNLNAKC